MKVPVNAVDKEFITLPSEMLIDAKVKSELL